MSQLQNSLVRMRSCALLPLTPALSLSPRCRAVAAGGERENRCQSVAESYLHGDFAERPLLFPLLEGAGQGEGKQSDLRHIGVGNYRSRQTSFGKVEDFSRSL